MNKIYHIVFVFVILLYSCESEEYKNLKGSLDRIAVIDNSLKYIVVIPNVGCQGCIDEAELFLKDNVDVKNTYFILTQISSLKLLKFHLGFDPLKKSNIIIDVENRFYLNSRNSIYPCVIYLEKKQITKYEFQSPNNPKALNNLQLLIN